MRLALRNLFRHRVRSSVAISAIAFSTIVLLLSGGFVEWIFWAMREATSETGLGHVQVIRKGYLDDGLANPYAYLLPAQSDVLEALRKDKSVKVVAQRLNFSGLVSFGDSTLSFVGTGIEADKEGLVSKNMAITEGGSLQAGDKTGVIVGAGLAKNLGVSTGSKLVLLVNNRKGGVAAVELTVRGVFLTRVKAFDDVALKVPLPVAQKLLGVDGAHVWVALLNDMDSTTESAEAFRKRFPDQGLEFIPWYQLADFYNKAVTLLSSQMEVVRLMIVLIIVLGISNMLIMNVLERTGEIGTLMALGARRSRVIRMFLLEGLLLGLVGGTIGLIIGFILATVLTAVGIPMPPPPGRSVGYSAGILLNWSLAFTALGLSAAAAFLASLYPSWKAARLVVVDALRQNR